MEDRRPTRVSAKTHKPNWKEKLRENCCKRIRQDRSRFLWRTRLAMDPTLNQKEIMESTFRDIVSDEQKKMNQSSSNDSMELASCTTKNDDILWEYDGGSKPTESDYEDILIEMHRAFYEDLWAVEAKRGTEERGYEVLEEEEDEYLAQAAFENLCLTDDEVYKKVVWCPICKRGELQEKHSLICCGGCKFQISSGDEAKPTWNILTEDAD